MLYRFFSVLYFPPPTAKAAVGSCRSVLQKSRGGSSEPLGVAPFWPPPRGLCLPSLPTCGTGHVVYEATDCFHRVVSQCGPHRSGAEVETDARQ